MVRQIKVLAAKDGSLSLSPEPTWWKEEINLGNCPLTSTCAHGTYEHTQKEVKQKKKLSIRSSWTVKDYRDKENIPSAVLVTHQT